MGQESPSGLSQQTRSAIRRSARRRVSRLLADENILQPAVHALRTAGHDVHAVLEDVRGAPDEEVLAAARAQSRILLTFDLDPARLRRSG